MDLAGHREEYITQGVDIDDVDPDPIVQFQAWFAEVDAAGLWEPNAMVVAAVDAEGWPTARWVLLKQVDEAGFVFYTNYNSAKAAALDLSQRASLTFGWHELRRQVRINGAVERLSVEESEQYFVKRPRGSQLGAWASPQSQPVADRAALDAQFAAVEERFGDGPIPKPDHWGGYRVVPERIEFWQGRPNRFHDRIVYTRPSNTAPTETSPTRTAPTKTATEWTRQRLAP